MFEIVHYSYKLLLAGVAAAALLAPQCASAQGFRLLYSFGNVNVDGASPRAGLTRDASGNLYGTTWTGGGSQSGNGTVFKLAPDGMETLLHAFQGGLYGDGNWPSGSLVLDGSGNLYGTTAAGGVDGGCGDNGCGTIFEIAPDGTETVLYIFSGGNDGATPLAALLPDGKGGFYGTAAGGGAHKGGMVFALSATGKESVLYAFTGGNDGGTPESTLIADKAGAMYGTTKYGGTGCSGAGCGTVFKLAPDGTETVLYAFGGGSDGANPVAGLIHDRAGNFYGTAEFGGLAGSCGGPGCGTVFKLTPSGSLSVLYGFSGGSDGAQPSAGLYRDDAGNLYGTTILGGSGGYGVVFRIATDGTEKVLHSFSNGADGGLPWCELVKDGKGRLVGTSSGGGGEDDGTIFRIKE